MAIVWVRSCIYEEPLPRFEWDKHKDRRNRIKHGLDFGLAESVFDDPFAITYHDRYDEDEERLRTIGSPGWLLTMLVVHADREEAGEHVVRIISARKATPQERRTYEENRKKALF